MRSEKYLHEVMEWNNNNENMYMSEEIAFKSWPSKSDSLSIIYYQTQYF